MVRSYRCTQPKKYLFTLQAHALDLFLAHVPVAGNIIWCLVFQFQLYQKNSIMLRLGGTMSKRLTIGPVLRKIAADQCHSLKTVRPYTSQSSIGSDIVRRLKGVPANAYALLLLPCITLYLGVWQIRRRKWKIGLIEDLDRKRRL